MTLRLEFCKINLGKRGESKVKPKILLTHAENAKKAIGVR
jgi:hypothetical protein